MTRMLIILSMVLILTGCASKTLDERILENDWDCDEYQCELQITEGDDLTMFAYNRSVGKDLIGIFPKLDSDFGYMSFVFESKELTMNYMDRSIDNVVCTYKNNELKCDSDINSDEENYVEGILDELLDNLE